MLNPQQFYEIVSGRRRGVGASLTRAALRLIEFPYTVAVRIRNRRYDRHPDMIHAVDVPVVSVGNLTLGGTGKTPMVEWLARWFRARDVRVTLVSRGYGAKEGSRNDEAEELEQKLPDVPHLQDADRVHAARLAVEEFECQLILLDDGFQHRRLCRDLDIVLLDALEPLGFGHVFPRGTLREPLSGLRRADVVVLSRADAVSPAERAAIRQQVEPYCREAVWAEASHQPVELLGANHKTAGLDSLAGQRVAAFCGIGNPDGFRHTLAGLSCELAELRVFPDHHAYTREDVASLQEWAQALKVQAVLCTHKDLVKLEVQRLGGVPLWAVRIGLEFLSGEEALTAQLTELLPLADD